MGLPSDESLGMGHCEQEKGRKLVLNGYKYINKQTCSVHQTAWIGYEKSSWPV